MREDNLIRTAIMDARSKIPGLVLDSPIRCAGEDTVLGRNDSESRPGVTQM